MANIQRRILRSIARNQLQLEGVPHPCRTLFGKKVGSNASNKPTRHSYSFFSTEWKNAAARHQRNVQNGRINILKNKQQKER